MELNDPREEKELNEECLECGRPCESYYCSKYCKEAHQL